MYKHIIILGTCYAITGDENGLLLEMQFYIYIYIFFSFFTKENRFRRTDRNILHQYIICSQLWLTVDDFFSYDLKKL